MLEYYRSCLAKDAYEMNLNMWMTNSWDTITYTERENIRH